MRLFRIISILFLLGYSRGGPYLLFADEAESAPSAETDSTTAPSTSDPSAGEAVIETPTETTIYERSESEAGGDIDMGVAEGETLNDPVAELPSVVEIVPPAADPNPASSIPVEQSIVDIPPGVTSGAGEDTDTSTGTADPETIGDTGSVVPYALETIYESTATGSAVQEEQIGTHLVFQTDTLTVSIPETVSIRTAGGADIPSTDLSVTILTPTQAHEKVASEDVSGSIFIPEIATGEVVPEQTLLDTISRYLGIARVFAIDDILPEISPGIVEEASGISISETSSENNEVEQPWSASFEFGIPETHLIFSDPVTIDYSVPFPDGTRMEVSVHHAGDIGWGMQGLSIFPEGTCLPDGSHTDTTNIATVIGGKARIYTCGASVFMFTYTGAATTGNFADNSTVTKTITIATGDVTSGFLLSDLNVIVDRHAIDGTNPAAPGAGNASPRQVSMTIQSPVGTTRTLLARNTYSNGLTPRVVTTFDDEATGAPSGTPTTGTFLPDQTLDAGGFSGQNPIGDRVFSIDDSNAGDGVILWRVSLEMTNIECGDGMLVGTEACDDGNTTNSDGCSATCTVEAGRSCTSASPSVCTLLPSATGLLLHYDGSTSGTGFADISGSGNHGTIFNGVTTGTANGEVYMCFNGTNQYVERATNLVTAYPFTMSAWVKSTTTAGVHGVMSFARSTATNIMYNIEHNGTTIRSNGQNTTARYANATTTLNTTQWFLVTAVYNSNTDRDVYVNGVYEGTSTNSVTYDANVTKRLNIGRFADSTPNSYFSGCIDDTRFYGNALTSGQISTLYAKPAALTTSLVATGSPVLTGTIGSTLDRIMLTVSGANYTGINLGNGTRYLSGGLISQLASGMYTTTLTVTNPYDRAVVYTSAFTVAISTPSGGDFCISAPTSISFPAFSTEAYAQTATVASSGYFAVIDSSGIDSGYYTTLQITALTGSTGTIPTTGIARLSTGVVLITGTANTGVVLGSAFSGYHYATGTVTFIYRNPAANSGRQGTYGAVLRLQLDLPAYIRPGAYAGTMTYTLYEN